MYGELRGDTGTTDLHTHGRISKDHKLTTSIYKRASYGNVNPYMGAMIMNSIRAIQRFYSVERVNK